MRLGSLPTLLASVVIATTCGCTAPGPAESADPGDSLLAGASDSKADGTVSQADLNQTAQNFFDQIYPGDRVKLAGDFIKSSGGSYSNDLHYSFSDAGIRIMDGFVDADDTLAMADGEYTEMALYSIHKTADQIGLLSVDTHGTQLAMRVLYKIAGETTRELPYVNRDHPFDIGRTNLDCSYLILVAPGGTRSGAGDESYSKLSIAIKDPG